MRIITFEKNMLNNDGISVEMPHDIIDAFALTDLTIVLLNPASYLSNLKPANQRIYGEGFTSNLLAVAPDGRKLWAAELPEMEDYYYRIYSRVPLIACTFSSYRCEVDSKNGKIARKEFLK